jgi:hypothetical protein
MHAQARAAKDGVSWFRQYRWELTALAVIAALGIFIGWVIRPAPPETSDVLSALHEYAALSGDSAYGPPPAMPTDMTLAEVAARTREAQLLKAAQQGDHWLVDVDLLATWTNNDFIHLKLQLKLRQKGMNWIITDARRM